MLQLCQVIDDSIIYIIRFTWAHNFLAYVGMEFHILKRQ